MLQQVNTVFLQARLNAETGSGWPERRTKFSMTAFSSVKYLGV